MIVIAHQYVRVHPKMELLHWASKQLQKLLSVLIVSKDCLPLVAPRRNVIIRAKAFYSQWTGHEENTYQPEKSESNRPDSKSSNTKTSKSLLKSFAYIGSRPMQVFLQSQSVSCKFCHIEKSLWRDRMPLSDRR